MPLFIKQQDVLQQDLVKSRNPRVYNDPACLYNQSTSSDIKVTEPRLYIAYFIDMGYTINIQFRSDSVRREYRYLHKSIISQMNYTTVNILRAFSRTYN